MTDGVELVTAYISIVPEGSKIAPEVRKQFGQVSKDADRAGRDSGKRFARSFGSVAKTAGAFALGGGLVSFFKASNDEAREAQKVGAQTNAVIKSTGNAAHVTAKQYGNLATAISLKTGIDDEQIQAGENMLATFTNIRNEQGKNNKIFTQATKISTDLAVATKTDQVAANVLLGKSLNDPVKGLGRLTKIGVTFTDQQKAQVAAMVKNNDTAGAQKVILRELAKEFGGSAAAQATAGDKLNVAWKNLEETVGTAALPLLDKAATKITKDVIPSLSEFVTGIQDGTGKGGEFADTIKHDVLPMAKNLADEALTLAKELKPLLGVLNDLPGPVKSVGLSAAALGSQLGKLRAPLPDTATKFEKLGRAGANLAGGAGLLLVADSANRSSSALGTLESAAGAALTGLAVGGPWGAAIGGTISLLSSIYGSGNDAAKGIDISAEAAKTAKSDMAGLSDAITDVTKGYDKLAKQQVAKSITDQLGGAQKASQVLGSLGLSMRDVTSAALGNQNALDKVNTAIDSAEQKILTGIPLTDALGNKYMGLTDAVKEASGNAGSLAFALDNVSGAAKDERAEAILAQLATGKLGQTLKDIPPDTVVKIGTEGGNAARIDIANLANSAKGLTNDQVTVLLATAGLPHAKDDIDALRVYANGLDGKKVTVTLLTSFQRKDALGLGDLPAAANGGPARRNEPMLVGERGPEIFTPSSSGRIVSNSAARRMDRSAQAAGGSVAVISPEALARAVREGLTGAITVNVDGIDMGGYMSAVAQDEIARAS